MKKIKVAITMGDPAGIGPEIIAKALNSEEIKSLADFVVIGDEWVFSKLPVALPDIQFIDLKNVWHKNFRFGMMSKENGRASLEYINKALELIKDKQINCLVTAPVSKEAICRSGVDFSGHTEYLAKQTNTRQVGMMFVVDKFRLSIVTRHIPLSAVSKKLSVKDILATIKLNYQALKEYFKVVNPVIGVCALNPHAGEGGLIGKEEERVIKPAIKMAKKFCKNILGPISADSILSSVFVKKIDCVIAMYHDQGLIPVKMLGFDKAVNMTLGLPFIRTSPDHGTAFNIASKGIACAGSLIQAIKLAVECQKHIS